MISGQYILGSIHIELLKKEKMISGGKILIGLMIMHPRNKKRPRLG